MLPRLQSLPSAGAQRHITSKVVPRISGRQLSTARRVIGGSTGLLARSNASSRARQAVAPMVLGSVASQRNLSWPSMPSIPYWNKPSTPAKEVEQSAFESSTAAANEANPQSVPVDSFTPPPAETTAPNPGLDAISDLVNSQSASEILSREEGIGYLSSLGLDFGWGFSSTMQWVVEHIHVWGGLGWASTICATAILLRAVMFYPTVKATRLTANMKRMQTDPRHKEATEKLKAAIRAGDREQQMAAQTLMKILGQEYNAPPTAIIWSLLPVPFSFGMFRVITGMTAIPVPSLETAGFAWFTDLTQSDPYFLLPILATSLMVFSVRRNALNSPPKQQAMAKKMVYFITPVMVIGTAYLSAAVNLMGLAFGGATLVSTLLLNNPTVRAALSIPPLDAPKPTPTYTAPRGVITPEAAGEAGQLPPKPPASWKEKIQDGVKSAQKALDNQTSKLPGQGSAEDRAERARRAEMKRREEQRRDQEREAFAAKYKGKGGR